MVKKRRTFGRDEQGTKKILNMIDAHYLLILTYLMKTLTEDTLRNRNKLDNEVNKLVHDLEDEVFDELIEVIDNTLISGMSAGIASIVLGWSKQDAKDYLEFGNNNISDDMKPLFRQLAEDRLKGPLTNSTIWDTVKGSNVYNRQAKQLLEDTYVDLLRATNNTDIRLKEVIRKISAEVLQLEGALSQNNKTLAERLFKALSEDEIYKRLTKEGLIGIVDAGGKRWRLDTYTKMVVNTKITDAHLIATKQSAEELGLDLAIISHNATTVDDCLNWEGVVVSVNGLTEGYPTLDDAQATNEVFHPNCRHHILLITGLDQLTDEQRNEHLTKLPKIANPENRPYRRQRQR